MRKGSHLYNSLRYHPNSVTARLWKRVQELETKANALDELIAAYPKEGKWDDALSVWAYGKGFDAGMFYAQREGVK